MRNWRLLEWTEKLFSVLKSAAKVKFNKQCLHHISSHSQTCMLSWRQKTENSISFSINYSSLCQTREIWLFIECHQNVQLQFLNFLFQGLHVTNLIGKSPLHLFAPGSNKFLVHAQDSYFVKQVIAWALCSFAVCHTHTQHVLHHFNDISIIHYWVLQPTWTQTNEIFTSWYLVRHLILRWIKCTLCHINSKYTGRCILRGPIDHHVQTTKNTELLTTLFVD